MQCARANLMFSQMTSELNCQNLIELLGKNIPLESL